MTKDTGPSGSAGLQLAGQPRPEEVALLIRAAVRAPSMHNTQPWRFRTGPASIEVHVDADRRLRVADPRGRGLCLSCGAAVFNLRLAAAHLGSAAVVRLAPDRGHPRHLATVRLAGPRRATRHEAELYSAIPRRRTNRQAFNDQPLPSEVATELSAAARIEGAQLTMLDEAQARTVLALAAEANRAWAADPAYRDELAQWIGDDGRRRDGVPATARGPRDAHGLIALRDFSGVDRESLRPAVPFELHPQIAVLSTRHDSVDDWLRAGQALQRALLTATALGLATSLLSSPIERSDLRALVAVAAPAGQPQIVLRLGAGPKPPPTPRRPLFEVTGADATGR